MVVNRLSSRVVSLPPMQELTPGERMKALRDARKLSLRQAAKLASVSHGTIQNLEARGLDGVSFGVASNLARAYGVSLLNLQRINAGLTPLPSRATEELGKYQVHPDWVALPVYGSVSAGEGDTQPLDDHVAYIPREHLARRGATIDTTHCYIVNGRCMISPEALRVDRTFAPGDYVAVDIAKQPEPGDVVVAWWCDQDLMVIKRFGYERENIVLTPIAPGMPSITLQDTEELHMVGPVVWRGG